MKQSIYRHSNPPDLLCCLQLSWFLYILSIYREILKRRKKTDDMSLVFFFCDLRVKGYILLFVLVQCLTDQLRNDVKMKQKVLERTWICKFLGENAPQTPSPTSLKAHAFGTRISFFKAKWVSALYPFKRGWNVYINGISKMLKKRSY